MLKLIRYFVRSISWWPIVSYFFLVFVFYIVVSIFAGNDISLLSAVLISLPFAFVLSWVLLKRIIKPLREIADAAKDMAGGNLNREIRIYTDDEIGDLARNINCLEHQLRQTISEITGEKDRMRAVLNSMTDGVVAVNGEGRVIVVNPAVERALNLSADQIKGKDIVGIIRLQDFENSLKTVMKTRKELSNEIQLLSPDPKIYRVLFTPLRGTDGGGVVAVLRDITEKRQLEQMRAEFIANVSHELRTPLTSIKGFLETLLDGAIDDRKTAMNFLSVIDNETDRMKRLIEDLFSLSNIESRKVVPAYEPLAVSGIIENVFDVFSQAAAEKGLKLVNSLGGDFPVIRGDKDMITRVFINLVENAIKYSNKSGEIVVEGGPHGDREVFVSVTDQGLGIPEECLPRVFERLYRVDKTRSREHGGSGLGLAIVKHIVDIHGGRIEVASKLGQGSRFTVYLPVMA